MLHLKLSLPGIVFSHLSRIGRTPVQVLRPEYEYAPMYNTYIPLRAAGQAQGHGRKMAEMEARVVTSGFFFFFFHYSLKVPPIYSLKKKKNFITHFFPPLKFKDLFLLWQ